MKSLVLYESYFGNTEKIAKAISETIKTKAIKLNEIKSEDIKELDLLVIGSPTRAFRPTPELTKFIVEIKNESLNNMKVAVFDTRISVEDTNSKILSFFVKLFGYAAESMEKKLRKKGAKFAAESAAFYVKESEGPLKDGELDKAIEWAKKL